MRVLCRAHIEARTGAENMSKITVSACVQRVGELIRGKVGR